MAHNRARLILATSMAMLAVLALAACSDGPASGSGANVVEDAEASDNEDDAEEGAGDAQEDDGDAREEEGGDEAEDKDSEEGPEEASEESADEAALGTRDNPLPLGTTIMMGDWELTITDVNSDAWEVIEAENQFNEAPAEGEQFVMFTVEATYQGDESGDPWLDFSWAVVGSGGNTFDGSSSSWCGTIPEPLNEQGETFPGGTVTGNECFPVASDQIEGATIRIEETFSFDDTRAFYALQ